jgi:hypothetical protein
MQAALYLLGSLVLVLSADPGRVRAPSELPIEHAGREGVTTALVDEAFVTDADETGTPSKSYLTIGGRHLPLFQNPSGIDDFGNPYQECDVTKPPAEQLWLQGLEPSLERSMGERRMNLRVSLYRCYALWHDAEIARLAEKHKDGSCSDRLPFVKRLKSGIADSLGQILTAFDNALYTGRLYFIDDRMDWGVHAIDPPFQWKWAASRRLFCEAPAALRQASAEAKVWAKEEFVGDPLLLDGESGSATTNYLNAEVFHAVARKEQQAVTRAYWEALPADGALGTARGARGVQPHRLQWLNHSLGLSGAFASSTLPGGRTLDLNWLGACHPADGFRCHFVGDLRRWLYSPNAATQAVMAGVLDQVLKPRYGFSDCVPLRVVLCAVGVRSDVVWFGPGAPWRLADRHALPLLLRERVRRQGQLHGPGAGPAHSFTLYYCNAA